MHSPLCRAVQMQLAVKCLCDVYHVYRLGRQTQHVWVQRVDMDSA